MNKIFKSSTEKCKLVLVIAVASDELTSYSEVIISCKLSPRKMRNEHIITLNIGILYLLLEGFKMIVL